jgi:aspartyl-tRNA(Asn)/glutamyl-tRNA(Gln) amidotransferase subunit B
MKYIPTIGMEIHVELNTETKMFCGCKNGMGLEKEPNKNICPICTGQPGATPVPNEQAIEFTAQAGLALECTISPESKFDRKNYFYPDLPKGYQISQYDLPICRDGKIKIRVRKAGEARGDNQAKTYGKTIGIHRIHLEEDTAKLTHSPNGDSLVDFNRSSVPLMELVSEPDLTSSTEAKKFCEDLQMVFRYVGISPADMEKGQMRCEANISLHKESEDILAGTKVELKNINSFRAIEKGIEYEIERQTEMLDNGEEIIQETRGWDENKGETFSQRKKENADDYRYFPDPDLQPFEFKKEYLEKLMHRLPELPREKRLRFQEEYNLLAENVETLIVNKELGNYFEEVASELLAWIEAEKDDGKIDKSSGSMAEELGEVPDVDGKTKTKVYRLANNYIITHLSKMMGENNVEMKDNKITAENFAELIKMIHLGEINSSAAQTILEEMFKTGGDPSHIAEEKDLGQVSDTGELETIVDKILADNPSAVEDFKAGKENSIKFLMGQVMAATKGKANPPMVMEMLKSKMK